MNGENQKQIRPKFFLLVAALFAVIVFCFSIIRPPQSRSGFLKQDKKFYAVIAECCGSLLSRTNFCNARVERFDGVEVDTMNQKLEYQEVVQQIEGDDKSLPKPLLRLHSTEITITNFKGRTNQGSRVQIWFGEPRPLYIITWCQSDYGNRIRPWELYIGRGATKTIVFSITNQLPAHSIDEKST